MLLTLVLFFNLQSAQAKLPDNANSYFCAGKKNQAVQPVFLHQTKDGLVLGVCGKKEEHDINNFSHLTVEVVSNTTKKKKKPIFSDKSNNKKFLVMEKRDGLILIEKIKVDNEYAETFRHEINCDKDQCKQEPERCIVINKVKQQWIIKNAKDSKIKSRMKKLGC